MTWRVSPVNDRLQAVNKHFPDTIRVLANASKLNASHFRQCSNKDVSYFFKQLKSLYQCCYIDIFVGWVV